MRILVATDRIGPASSGRAGRLIASGWPQADARAVPVGAAGAGFVEAYADAVGVEAEHTLDAAGLATLVTAAEGSAVSWEPSVPASDGLPYAASSHPLGTVLGTALARDPRRVLVDLAGTAVHDGGAGLLSALGARGDVPLDHGVEPLAGLTALDLRPARASVGNTELIGVVPEGELAAQLLGLRGITSRLGREQAEDPARMLAVDGALERFAGLAAPDLAGAAGAGACGGLGFAVLALGGRLVSGPSVTLDAAAGGCRPDLVITGCSVFDFAHRGGGVVEAVARLAGSLLAPCILLAGEVFVGAREQRAMGIEASYAVRGEHRTSRAGIASDGSDWCASEQDIVDLARRVARNWSW